MSDSELVRRSLSSPETFGELFERHFDAVRRFAAYRVGAIDAYDIAGDAFRTAFEIRDRFDGTRNSALPWLIGIARNKVLERSRSLARQASAYARAGTVDFSASCEDDVESRMLASIDLIRIRAELERAPRDWVEPLLLHVWDGLSYDEISQVLDVPVGTVRSRISRLRVRLRTELQIGTDLARAANDGRQERG